MADRARLEVERTITGEPVRLCACPIWMQRWKRSEPERCMNCGGLFDPATVPARRWRPGDPEWKRV